MRFFRYRNTSLFKSLGVLLTIAALAIPQHAHARQDTRTVDSRVPAEYETVVSAVQKVMGLLSDVTQRHATEPINDQILAINDRLTLSGPVTGGFRGMPEEDLLAMLREIERDLEKIVEALDDRGEDDLAYRLASVLDDLEDAIEEAADEDVRIRRDAPNRYEIRNGRDRVAIKTTDDDWWDEDDRWERREEHRWKRDREEIRNTWRDTWKSGSFDSFDDSDAFGEWNWKWPYQNQAWYRNIPSIRYNRVEGLFLGVSRAPLEWSSWDRGRIYGQGGYAFALDQWQYRIGAETRFGSRKHTPIVDLKVGGSYQRNTDTDDLWKASWGENTAFAFFFRHDFFDYFQTEGWTGYAVARLSRYAQLSAAYRSEDYQSLSRNTNWSIFGEGNFRANPRINEGLMNSIVLAFEGGSISNRYRQPSGMAFRLEAELGQDMGGDFDYSRYLGDVRTYARLTRETGLSLRFRGGFTEGTVPLQKAFTLGGIGSVRGYNQNQFIGTRMVLANAELALFDADLVDWALDDLTIFGTFDAGWTNLQAGSDVFSAEDMFSSAGFGVALDDHDLRLEVAWPLQDLGTDYKPSVWIRFNPSF